MADKLADPRPRHPAQVQQRDAAVAQVVRRERRHAGGGAGAGDRGRKPVGAEALEHRPIGDAVVARHERRRRPRRASAGSGTQRAAPVFATAAETRQRPRGSSTSPQVSALELADPHPGRVEHEQRQPVAGGEEPDDGLDVLGGRRLRARGRSSRGSLTVSRSRAGFGCDARVVEHHREHGDGLADRLLLAGRQRGARRRARRPSARRSRRRGRRRERGRSRPSADAGTSARSLRRRRRGDACQRSASSASVGTRSARGERRGPARASRRARRRSSGLPRVRLTLRLEGAAVAGRRLAAAEPELDAEALPPAFVARG